LKKIKIYFQLLPFLSGAAPEPWLGGGGNQVITLQNLITKRKQQFLQHKFKSSIFKTGKISII
jgi:hypothetical protein